MLSYYEEFIDLLPDEVKNSDDFQKLIKIFFELLEESADLSVNTTQVKLVDSLFEKFSKTKEVRYSDTRTTILKTALNEMFWTLDDASKSTELYDKLATLYKRLGISTQSIDMVKKIDQILTDQNIIVNKSFNYNKGKYTGYLYIFDLIEKAQIQGLNTGGFLKLIEGTELDPKEPFNYRVETSLYKETYEQTVHPMVHPIGFGYVVRTILEFAFEDYFSSKAEITLEKAVIQCLQPDGSYIETNILTEYDVQYFNEQEKEGLKRFWVVVKDKQTGETIKFVSDFDNSVKSYSLDDLEVYDVVLNNEGGGILQSVSKVGINERFKYNQFFINRKKFVEVKYKIVGDKDEKVYVSYIAIDPDSLKKVTDENYLEEIYFTTKDLLKNTLEDINGRTIREYDRNCGFNYSIKIEYVTTVTDEIITEVDVQQDDWWARKTKCKRTNFFIDRLEDFSKNPPETIPYVSQDNLFIGDNSTTDFFIDQMMDLTKNPSTWVPKVGDNDLFIGLKKEGCNCETYYVGLGVNYCDNNRWEPIINEYYLGQKSRSYNKDYRDQPLPKIDDLGKDTNYWVYEQPIYNINRSSTIQESGGFELSQEYSPAFEAFYTTTDYSTSKIDWRPKFEYWSIEDDNIIGDNYSDEDLKEIADGNKIPTKGKIACIGRNIIPEIVDGEVFGKKLLFNEYKIKEEIPAVNDIGFYIGSRYSDEDIEKIKNKTLKISSPVYDIIGIKYTPEGDDNYISLGIAGIREEFSMNLERTDSFEDNIEMPTELTNYNKKYSVVEERNEVLVPLIGEDDWYIGERYTDDEIKKIKRNILLASPSSYDFIGVKYKATTSGADISTPMIGEEGWTLGSKYSDEELERIRNNLLLVNSPVFDLIGYKYITNDNLENVSVYPMIGEEGWNIGSDLSDEEINKLKNNKLRLKRPSYDLIGYKYTTERKQGEHFAAVYDEETITEKTLFNTLEFNNSIADLVIGEEGWNIGNNYSDEDILRIKKNTLKVSENVYLIGSKYISIKEDGERFTSVYDEEFKIDIRKTEEWGIDEKFTDAYNEEVITEKHFFNTLEFNNSIVTPMIGEEGWVLGSNSYSDEELEKIKKNILKVSDDVYLIGSKYISVKEDGERLVAKYDEETITETLVNSLEFNNSIVTPLIGEESWYIGCDISDEDLEKINKNILKVKENIYLIGSKYISIKEDGERLVAKYDEEFEIEVRKKILDEVEKFTDAYNEETTTEKTLFNGLEFNNSTTIPMIGEEGWNIGDNISDEELKKIKRNTLKVSNDVYVVGSKYISVKEDGERFTSVYDEEFEVESRKYILKEEVPLISESDWEIGEQYTDDELEQIIKKTKRITSPVFDLIGKKFIPAFEYKK